MKNTMIVAAILLAGCANTSDPTAVKKATKSSYDAYSGQTTVSAAMVKEGHVLTGSRLQYRLEAEYTKDAEPALHLYVGSDSDKGVVYAASDIDAVALSVSRLDKKDMPADENVVLPLSREYLVAHKASGLNIRLTASRGELTVTVPGSYVDGFLAKLDDVNAHGNLCNGKAAADTKPGFFARLFHLKAADSSATCAHWHLTAGE